MSKYIIGMMLFSFSVILASAANAAVYCKAENNQIIDATSEEGYECVGALLTAETTSACFTGKREAAIDVLNSLFDLGVFDGTDGEYIKSAHFKGASDIAYTIVDESNEVETKTALRRCTSTFFKN